MNTSGTSAPNVFAAGDITGRLILVPQAAHDGFVAATNAVQGAVMPLWDQVSPVGSFTDPEYAQVGLTEVKARETYDVVAVVVRFDETPRTIIDGRRTGFCKLITNRATAKILGCHVVGERAVEIVQVVAIAIAAGLGVDNLVKVPLSFPTYAGILGRAAYRSAQQIDPEFSKWDDSKRMKKAPFEGGWGGLGLGFHGLIVATSKEGNGRLHAKSAHTSESWVRFRMRDRDSYRHVSIL